MDKYDIQVNKTSRNSVLFQTHIGTTTSSTAYLLQCLSRAAKERDTEFEESSKQELKGTSHPNAKTRGTERAKYR